MKDIEKKDHPEVSGGFSPDDDGCFPRMPIIIPREPIGPFPEPLPGPGDPEPFVPAN